MSENNEAVVKKEYKLTDRIKPIKLADMLGIRPQQIFSLTRNGTLPMQRNDEGKQTILMQDVVEYYKASRTKKQEQLDKLDTLLNSITK